MATNAADQKYLNRGSAVRGPGSASGGQDDDLISELERIIAGEEEGDDSFVDEHFWQDAVLGQIHKDISDIAKAYEVDLGYIEGWFEGQKDKLVNFLSNPPDHWLVGDPNSTDGMQRLIAQARYWVGTKWPPFQQAMNDPNFRGGGGGGGGGGGRRAPTAAEIRAQFDMDQLTEAVNSMSRGLILSEMKDARAIAKSYVDAIVANPTQELDFEQYARSRILKTDRANVIYADKPDSLSHEQFLQPYVQSAQQMIGPGFGEQLPDLAINAARLGASPQAFMSRLQRERQVQTSAPFLSRLGQEMSNLKQVLR